MSSYPAHVWNQLKNLTAEELCRALDRDGWIRDTAGGSMRIYRHPDGRRVSVHYHAQKTYGPKMLKGLFDDMGWSLDDMRRLKLIK